MKAASVFIKTQKGRDEVRTRSHRLSARERTTLIMVDGTRCLADIQAVSPTPDEVETHLQRLLETGLIGPGTDTTPDACASLAAPDPSPEPACDPDLEKTRRFIQEVAEDTLGRDAAAFTDTLVAANDTQSLLKLAQHLRDVLYRMTNGKEADQFLQTVRELAPKF